MPSYGQGRYRPEMKFILTDILADYSRPLCLSLFQKAAFAELLSELEKKQFTLCSELQLGQWIFIERERFITPLEELLNQKIDVGEFEWQFLNIFINTKIIAQDTKEAGIVLDINNSLMPTFYNKVLTMTHFCAIDDFNAALENHEMSMEEKFKETQNNASPELKTLFLDVARETYDSLISLSAKN